MVVSTRREVHQIPALVRWTFLLFVFSLPFEAAAEGTMSLSRMSGMIFFAACLLYPRRWAFHPPSPIYWFLGYFVFYIIGGLLLPDAFYRGYLTRGMTLIQLFALFWFASWLFRNERFAEKALATFAVACATVATGALLGLSLFVSSGPAERVNVFGFGTNYAASLMAFAALIAVGVLLNREKKPHWFNFSAIIIFVTVCLLMVLTGSRAATGSLVLGLFVYLLPHWKSRGRLMTVVGGGMAISFVILMIASDPTTASRWGQFFAEGDTAGRERIYPAVVEMFLERPIFGWQPNYAFYELARRASPRSVSGKDAHNLFFYLLLEVGLLGTVPFLVGMGICGRGCWRRRRGNLGLLPAALFIVLITYNVTHTGINRKPTWLIFALGASAGPSILMSRRKVLARAPAGPAVGAVRIEGAHSHFWSQTCARDESRNAPVL